MHTVNESVAIILAAGYNGLTKGGSMILKLNITEVDNKDKVGYTYRIDYRLLRYDRRSLVKSGTLVTDTINSERLKAAFDNVLKGDTTGFKLDLKFS